MNGTGRTVLIVILVVIALPLLWGAVMMGGMGPGMMGGWGAGDRWEPWRALFGLLSTVLVIGGIGALVVWAIGRSPSALPPSGQPSARDILDARYARGEIAREEYQRIRSDLGS